MAASFHIQGEGGKQAEKLRADSMSAHNENPKSGSINLNTFINMVTYKYLLLYFVGNIRSVGYEAIKLKERIYLRKIT